LQYDWNEFRSNRWETLCLPSQVAGFWERAPGNRLHWTARTSLPVRRGVRSSEDLKNKPGIPPHDIMVLFIETARENWAFANGVQYYVETEDRNWAIR
jgi:hypothetical protein